MRPQKQDDFLVLSLGQSREDPSSRELIKYLSQNALSVQHHPGAVQFQVSKQMLHTLKAQMSLVKAVQAQTGAHKYSSTLSEYSDPAPGTLPQKFYPASKEGISLEKSSSFLKTTSTLQELSKAAEKSQGRGDSELIKLNFATRAPTVSSQLSQYPPFRELKTLKTDASSKMIENNKTTPLLRNRLEQEQSN